MKKLIILAMILVSMVIATVALAAPGENSPWESTSNLCDHPSGAAGELYFNANSGNYHCFKI